MEYGPDWLDAPDKPGYKFKELKIELKNGGCCNVTIYRPILDDAERKKREDHLKRVAESVLASYYKRKEQEKL